MDKLDKIFLDHRDEFETEPDEGHLQRFEARLDNLHQRRKPLMKRFSFTKVAAALIVLLLAANLLVYLLPQKPQQADTSQPNTEMTEAVGFYSVRINSGLAQLQQMASQGIGSQQDLAQVRKELGEMDNLFRDLQKEYSANPNDERVVNAMIEYYQTKLEIINRIMSDLENVKSINNKKNENTKL